MPASSSRRMLDGSSPRTRGTGVGVERAEAVRRFIPAHAGNSQELVPNMDGTGGSSPRTRGTEHLLCAGVGCGRFIPAHAGNSRCPAGASSVRPVHPRARGEQLDMMATGLFDGGSSPRTRGTVLRVQRSALLRRFIPAHAGNSPRGRRSMTTFTVHPRARGEQLRFGRASVGVVGSSPRTRGTALATALESGDGRFIPAHAGNRYRRAFAASASTVHPRARGEQLCAQASSCASAGSSPRTRGTAVQAHHHHQCARFIPAHAGNS